MRRAPRNRGLGISFFVRKKYKPRGELRETGCTTSGLSRNGTYFIYYLQNTTGAWVAACGRLRPGFPSCASVVLANKNLALPGVPHHIYQLRVNFLPAQETHHGGCRAGQGIDAAWVLLVFGLFLDRLQCLNLHGASFAGSFRAEV